MTIRSCPRAAMSAQSAGQASSILRGALGLGLTVLVAMMGASTIAQARETLLDAGTFVADGKPCRDIGSDDVLVSNGHAVAPPGMSCRVASRTSAGVYYPHFNEVCTGNQSMTAVLSVENRHTISFRFSGQARRSYRFCPLSATQLARK